MLIRMAASCSLVLNKAGRTVCSLSAMVSMRMCQGAVSGEEVRMEMICSVSMYVLHS